jgi:hypothetical protein
MTQKPFGVKQLNVIGAAGTPTIESAGDLNIGGQQVAITTNTSIAGVITATSFFGDGSGLTGVTGSGSGVVIQEEGSSVGTAGTINFIGAGVTATLSGGIASVEITSSGGGSGVGTDNVRTSTLVVSGVSTFQSSVNLGELDRLNFYTANTGIYGNSNGLNIEASANNDINIKSNSSGGNSGDVKLRTVEGGRIDLTGTGGVGIYYTDTSLKLATNSTGIDVSGTITANGLDMEDNEKILLGTGDDLEIYHDGNSYLSNTNAASNLFVTSAFGLQLRVNSSEVALSAVSDGAVELYHNNSKKFETTGSGVNVSGIVTATSFSGDGSALTNLPAGGIAGINTTGTSYFNDINIEDTGKILSDTFSVRDSGDSLNKMFFGNSGTGHVVRLYANGNERFTTTANGIFVQNEIITTDIKSSGISTFNNVNFDDQITYTASTNRMQFGDDAELRFGDGGDLSIYHTAGDIGMSYNSEGVFFLRSNTNFQIDKNGSKRLYAHSDGAVDLYYNDSKRLETTSVGVALTGTVDTAGLVVSGVSTLGVTSISQLQIAGVTTTSSDIHLNQDNATLRIGANGSGDIRIYHTGTASVYYDNYGTTKFLGGSWDFKNIADNKTAAHFDQDSGQELYFDGSKKFETTTTGVTVTGDASVSGEVTAASYKSNDTTGDGSDVGFAIKYYVTSNGSSAYRFAGPGLVNTTDNPTLYLHRGFTYIFENSTGSSHPFRIQFTNTNVGVTTYLSGSNNGTQVFTIPFDAPSSYEYQCTLHSGMKGTLAIPT